jgi:glutamyl-tRNA synthetase
MTVRVRFAPSPTGPLHIGGIRTAIYNYLFARKHGGTFILRVEDTDQNRYVEGAESYVIEALQWLGLVPDEGPEHGGDFGPYRQSERKALYGQYAQQLVDSGWAYYAFDTGEALTELRREAEAEKQKFIYNHSTRMALVNSLSLSKEEVEERLQSGNPYVIRFKMPAESLVMEDIVRGEITVNTALLDDKILMKGDGMPTYHLANIVDDHLMEITHVIRGEEWLPSMPLHILLYRAFDWQAPQFAHLPLILKPVGKGKLSKRDGDKLGFPVFPLLWVDPETGQVSAGYREDGYFPDAVVNMLSMLGWNEGNDRELYRVDELIEAFSLQRVSKSGAKFDPVKTRWFNCEYLRQKPTAELVDAFATLLAEKSVPAASTEYLTTVVESLRERATFVADFWEQGSFYFEAPQAYDPKAAKKWKAHTPDIMSELCGILETAPDFSPAPLSDTVKAWIGEKGVGFGQVMQPLRLSLVGASKGPDIFDIASMLGREETISRIQHAIESLSA